MHASHRSKRSCVFCAAIAVAISMASAISVSASEPGSLAAKIDQTFNATTIGPVAPPIDDLTFVRRVYLDLLGRIPSVDETRQFLSATSEIRRTELVDTLLASNECNRNLATRLHVMLMERRGGKHVKVDELQNWFLTSVEKNKPFNQLAGELIAADTSDANRPSAAFVLERDAEPNLLTREVSRMFFGRDIQCAQCHDHPNVDDYKQEDYFGLYAFMSRTTVFQPDTKKPATLSESADGQLPFKSVFTDREAFTSPRMSGEPELTEPVFAAGDEYAIKPSKTTAAVPKYSRRTRLAELVATGENDYFRRNIANRLWAMVMGQGLVQPVDMHHCMNPPSHPELMTLLAGEFAAMNFQIKPFLRELLLTDVYQRSHQFTETPSANIQQLQAAIEQLKQQRDAANHASSTKEAEAQEALEQLDAVIATAEPVRAAWAKARAASVTAATKNDGAVAAKQSKATAVTAKQSLAANLAESLASIDRASELLGSPKELATVSATLKAKTDTVTAESTKLQTELDVAAKAVSAAEAALKASQTAEQTEYQKLTVMLDPMRQHRSVMVAAWRASERAYETVTHADEEVEYLQQLVACNDTDSKLPAVSTEISTIARLKQASLAAVVTMEAETEAAAKQIAEAQQNYEQTARQATELTAKMAIATESGQLLSEAIAQAKSASALLKADRQIAQISDDLQKAAGRINGTIGETRSQLEAKTTDMATVSQSLAELNAAMASAKQQADVARLKATTAETQLTELNQQLTSLQSALEEAEKYVMRQSTRKFQLATVEAVTPEQLAWSILQCSGHIDRLITSELAKLNKEKPLDEAAKTPEALEQRLQDAKAAAVVSLTKTAAGIVSLFAAQTGQPQDDFFATVDQALFLANGGEIRSWLAPSGKNLTARLLAIESADQLAEELYLSALVRKPTAEETHDVAEYLKVRGEQKKEAVQELAWALITSAEFRFQY